MKNIGETKNYFIEEIKQNELMSKKQKKVYRDFDYTEIFFNLVSTVTWCESISSFASLIGIPIGIASFAIRLTICAITAGIKRYKSADKKQEEKHVKMVLPAKSKLNSIKFLISKTCRQNMIIWKRKSKIIIFSKNSK